jgi:hypothetical protein
MRLMEQGQDAKSIRAYIDAQYSQFGPPTDTDPIQGESQSSCSPAATETCGDSSISSSTNPVNLPPMTVPQPPGGETGSKEAKP